MPTRRQHALLAVARRRLALGEERWRAILAQAAGVGSERELDQAGFEAVLAVLEHLGFAPAVPLGPTYGDRPGFATAAQVQLIRVLWREWSLAEGDDRASGLDTWLRRSFGVDSLRFLTAGDARGAITALKKMKARKRAA